MTKSLGGPTHSPPPELTQSFRHIRRTMPDVLEVEGTMGLSLIVRSVSQVQRQLNSKEAGKQVCTVDSQQWKRSREEKA